MRAFNELRLDINQVLQRESLMLLTIKTVLRDPRPMLDLGRLPVATSHFPAILLPASSLLQNMTVKSFAACCHQNVSCRLLMQWKLWQGPHCTYMQASANLQGTDAGICKIAQDPAHQPHSSFVDSLARSYLSAVALRNPGAGMLIINSTGLATTQPPTPLTTAPRVL